MLRRIVTIMRRDMANSLRDFILIYALAAPLLLALVTRLFLPSVGAASLNLVVMPDLGDELIAGLRGYADVEMVRDRAALDERVLCLDDAAGIVRTGDAYQIVLEGNENHDTAVLPAQILARLTASDVVATSETDLGRQTPLRSLAAIMLALTAMLMGGMIIGFSIIEEKESGTLTALAVSPLSRFEFIGGRSVLGVLLSLVLVLGSIWLVGAWPAEPLQLIIATLVGSVLAIVFGFYLGSVSENQVAGIGMIKFGALIFMAVPLVGLLLPERLQYTCYWVPTYWTFRVLQGILTTGLPWAETLRLSGLGFGVSLLFLAASWQVLRRKLSLRG